ncbi:hypothetical protein Tco_0213046 [Tanacetum coccineum]
MAPLKYVTRHNQVGFLKKPTGSDGFGEIVDFLRGSNLRYALVTNLTIYDSLVKQFWQTATVFTNANATQELRATIDTIAYTITKASVRHKLQLADAEGISMLPNDDIMEGIGAMGYPTDGSFTFWKNLFSPQWKFLVHHILHCISSKSGGWDQFGSNLATALICLSTGRVFNFSKLIFDGMVANHMEGEKDVVHESPVIQDQPSSSTAPPPSPSPPITTQPTSTSISPTHTAAPTPSPPSHSPEPHHDYAHMEYQPSPSPQPTHFPEATAEPMSVEVLLQLVPQLMQRIDSLETSVRTLQQSKETMGLALVKLVKKVKKLDKGRKLNMDKDKSSWEADVSSQGLEAAETLAKVKSASEELKSASEELKSGEGLKSVGEKVNSGDEEQDFASMAEIARIQAEEQAELEAELKRKAEIEKMDALAARRLEAQLELSKAQKNRMEQVQESAKLYTEEDWDVIMAKILANADLAKEIVQGDVSKVDYAQKMVEIVNQRRKLIAEQKAKEKRDKPMTQAEQRNYMMTFVKNQGHGWTLTQLKKLTFEELKTQFELTMKNIERFIPMESEKEGRKRIGEELQTGAVKKARTDKEKEVPLPKEIEKNEQVKEEEEFEIKKPVIRYGKRKSLARKGLQKKAESSKEEEDVEAYMKEKVKESSSEEFTIGSIPEVKAPAKIVRWQIIKTGQRANYLIVREDYSDLVYINFQGLLNGLTRDDLHELYKLMMEKHGNKRPEEEYERVLWGDLKTMFDPPYAENEFWKLAHQQQVVGWRYFSNCAVHCLSLETVDIYMLTDVVYPLPPRVCKAMLEKKLLGNRKDEHCYQLLKMIERQSQGLHKDWLVQEQTVLELASPQFMVCGKDLEIHIRWLTLYQKVDGTKGLTSPEQTAKGVNTPRSDENRLKLNLELMYIQS